MGRKQLKEVAAEGDEMGFNRQINPWVLEKLSKHGEFAVIPMLIHEHIADAKFDPHVRTLVGIKLESGKLGSVFIDMKTETFNRLPQ